MQSAKIKKDYLLSLEPSAKVQEERVETLYVACINHKLMTDAQAFINLE